MLVALVDGPNVDAAVDQLQNSAMQRCATNSPQVLQSTVHHLVRALRAMQVGDIVVLHATLVADVACSSMALERFQFADVGFAVFAFGLALFFFAVLAFSLATSRPAGLRPPVCPNWLPTQQRAKDFFLTCLPPLSLLLPSPVLQLSCVQLSFPFQSLPFPLVLPSCHTEFASMGSSGRSSVIAPAAVRSAALFDQNATRRSNRSS